VGVRLSKAAAARPQGANLADFSCAFVNNMPDGAFDATERQFLDLLDTAAGPDVIEVRRYAFSGVPRGERVATRLEQDYEPVETLLQEAPDVLIVTGSNPVEERIEDEPYWVDLAQLITWGSEHVASMLLSCLSAHAALGIFDGIERVRLATKCTGVFPQDVDVSHPLTVGMKPRITLPHSRTSTVPEEHLLEAGYHIAVRSDEVGWAVASRRVDQAQVLLVQGHPEYDPSSLLREYRRDVWRYAQHERDDEPILPYHCVAPEDWPALEEMHRAIIGGRRDPDLVAAYPFDEVGQRATWPWHAAAEQLYTNWVNGFTKRSD
jgi:homoserine O-succinyltransferase/O-acetyltransferase